MLENPKGTTVWNAAETKMKQIVYKNIKKPS